MQSITKRDSVRIINAVQKALAEGFPPPLQAKKGQQTAISRAASKLMMVPMRITRLLAQDGAITLQHGLAVDWSKYSPKASNDDAKASKATDKAIKPEEPPADPIIVRTLRDKLQRAEREAIDAQRLAASASGLRSALFRLTADPLQPPSYNPVIGKHANDDEPGEVIILTLSDIHFGEVIDLAQMGGRNSYNQHIAAARIERYFRRVVKLATVHWHGPRPAAIYVALMGDLISGEIHEELAKTNDLLAIPAVRALSECLIAGIDLLVASFPGTPIHVVSIPGNHGRSTRKPEAKGFAIDSYDTLTAWMVEGWYRAKGVTQVDFSAPASGDALIDVYGFNILLTHGDRIGSRGGMGFIGPAATIARGMQRCIQDYASEGVIVDKVVVGHFHSSLELTQGFANGSMPGPSEYSKAGRLGNEPACQWMLSVHHQHGVARRWKVFVGDESEGSIYRSRANG